MSSVLLMLLTGRIAGISGIFAGLLNIRSDDKAWRIAFIAGLILVPVIAGWIGYGMAPPKLPASWIVIVGGGTAGRLRHAARRRLHLRPRHLRDRTVFRALDRGHHRLHGDGGRSPWRSRITCWEAEPCGSLRRLLCGLIFGAGLLVSGMVQPTKVLGFLDIFGAWDPSLAVVMAAALAVAVPGFMLARNRVRPIAGRTIFLARANRRSMRRWCWGQGCSGSAGALSDYARGRRWRASRRCRRVSSCSLPPWPAGWLFTKPRKNGDQGFAAVVPWRAQPTAEIQVSDAS